MIGVPVHSGDMLNSQKGLGKTEDGVLFITYQMLISNKRMEQIISWLGPNGAENFGGKKKRGAKQRAVNALFEIII